MYVYLCMYERMSPRMDMGGLLKYIHCVYAYGYAYYLVFYAKILSFKIIKIRKTYKAVIARPTDFRRIPWGRLYTSRKTVQERAGMWPAGAGTSTCRYWLSSGTDNLKS